MIEAVAVVLPAPLWVAETITAGIGFCWGCTITAIYTSWQDRSRPADELPAFSPRGLYVRKATRSVPAGCAWGWGNKWGNLPHRSQPIPTYLDLAETA
jgi:hypothetical protein